MSDPDVQRDLGRLEAALAASKQEISQLRDEQKEIKKVLTEILVEIQQRRGGTKYLFMALTVAAALGGIADRIISWLKIF